MIATMLNRSIAARFIKLYFVLSNHLSLLTAHF